MSKDRNPYYDSARGKSDRSEFASLNTDLPARQQSAGGGSSMLRIVVWVVALVVIAAIAKRFFFA